MMMNLIGTIVFYAGLLAAIGTIGAFSEPGWGEYCIALAIVGAGFMVSGAIIVSRPGSKSP